MQTTKKRRGIRKPDYLPTPEEIRAECAKIRSEWTEEDWRRRVSRDAAEWTLPEVGSGLEYTDI